MISKRKKQHFVSATMFIHHAKYIYGSDGIRPQFALVRHFSPNVQDNDLPFWHSILGILAFSDPFCLSTTLVNPRIFLYHAEK